MTTATTTRISNPMIASAVHRVAARFIDGIVLMLAGVPLGFVDTLWALAALVAYLVGSNMIGESIGKHVLGILIVGAGGARPGVFRGALRSIDLAVPCAFVLIAPALGLAGLIIVIAGGALLFVHPQRRTLWDLIAGTYVVYAPFGAMDRQTT